MKKIILSLVALFGALTANAQQTETISATLQTGDNTQVFYSTTALVDALKVADNGSIITLSSGTFNVPGNIEKSVKIYGAGYLKDKATGIERTYLNGGITFSGVYNEHIDNVYMEGLYINGDININNASNDELIEGLKFVKCSFNSINFRENCDQILIRQCYVRSTMWGENITATGFSVENSWIGNRIYNFNAATSGIVIKNCVVAYSTSSSYDYPHGAYYYENCIFNNKYVDAGAVLVNCLGYKNAMTNGGLNTNTNCYYEADFIDLPTLFADHQGNFNFFDTENTARTWILSNPTKFAGADGNPVGPTGGDFAWDLIPSTPRITSSTIASKTVDGKLNISIKAEARPISE